MRFSYLLAPILFALSPLSIAASEHEHEHEQSLDAHVHGVATLNVGLDDQQLELQFESPTMNIFGFEYKPSSENDKQALIEAELTLKNEQALFKLSSAAQCVLSAVTIENDLVEPTHDAHEHEHDEHADAQDEQNHSDIQVGYLFNCATPDKLHSIDLAGFFKAFPHTEKINVQLMTSTAQLGVELSQSNTVLNW